MDGTSITADVGPVWVRLLFVLLSAAAFSCGQAPGSFAISFTWDIPPAATVWVWVRVEERLDPEEPGPILASAGPEARENESSLSLGMDSVAHGKNRVVIVEVRDGPSPNQPVIYYGFSQPFELAPGRHVDVEVPLVLQLPESDLYDAEVLLLFDGAARPKVTPLQASAATVRTRSAGAVSAVLANDASFELNRTDLLLADGQAAACVEEEVEGIVWTVCEIPGWDLTAGFAEIVDQQYTLFVRFVDRYGYESQVYKASVEVDSQPPIPLVGWLSAPVVAPASAVWGWKEPAWGSARQ